MDFMLPHHKKRLKEDLYNCTCGATAYIKSIAMLLETEQITQEQHDQLKEALKMSMEDSLNKPFDIPELRVYWQAIMDI